MKQEIKKDDISALSFEEALKQLEVIVENLECGDVPLEQSIDIYERGEALKNHCDKLLKVAETKIEKIQLSNNGTPEGVKPLDPE
ncbi:exodeoxyribonuclease VII small subunit [Bartonella bacilliformis]|uniref:Exodeoxyribonuclease 7 small subunit n=1 Tax=Bartonella bacilliformis Ver097 TaxID=1293911 RepID=A0A072REI8_BARBA|nr:exodeoxyribonuclease VII small subunit [Bartonella bacilliformis]KEG19919.1 exodeoxyribonuclease 7 small subunit [Bartonella bacilliformis Ver097]